MNDNKYFIKLKEREKGFALNLSVNEGNLPDYNPL